MPRFFWLLALVSIAAATAAAQAPPRAADLVAWTVAPAVASRGGTARVVFRATIASGWRLYALGSPVGRPLSLAAETLPAGVEALPALQARPQQGYDEAFEQAYPYFSETAEVALPLRVASRAARGRHVVAGTVRYALCDDSICLPPASVSFRTTLTVR